MSLRLECYRKEIIRALTYVRDGIKSDLDRGFYMTQAPYSEVDIEEMRVGIADINAMIAGLQTST